jgi:PD-(D/E)XK nuclease superfamily protein
MPSRILWSNSRLTLLQMCGERFRRREIEKEYVPPSARMIRGTVVHASARKAYLARLKGLDLPSREEARDEAATEFERVWSRGWQLAPDEAALEVPTVKANAKDFAVDLSTFHAEKVAPLIEPRAVEHRITVRPKDSDLEIAGTIDLVARIPGGDGECIRDLKTSERSPRLDAADNSQQLSLYGLIRLAETGELPPAYALDYLVRTPAKSEKSHRAMPTTRTRDDLQVVVNRLNAAVESVARGAFHPADPSSWWCSRNYCEYWDSCKYAMRGPSRPTS